MEANQHIDAAASTSSALSCSMHTVLQALASESGVSAEQMIAQIQEWRGMLDELVSDVSNGIENARLKDELRQANLARSEFVSFVAHELRTPMTSIRGYADLLKGGIVGPLNAQQSEFVEVIVSNIERMQMLVSDLHDVSRIETGRIRLEVKPTSLEEALDGALKLNRRQIEARSQRLIVDIPQGLPKASADPARLEQILANLLSNSIKYTPERGQISVCATLEADRLRCTVSDTGIGISDADQEQLFTKHFRSSDRAVREMPGTGLGLCIVKSLVELQGGNLRIRSQLGEGTTIAFTLPIGEDTVAQR